MPDFSAVIFDFDGVLADTERLHLTAFQNVFRERGWVLDERTYFDRYLGCDDDGLVVAFTEDNQLAIAEEDRARIVAAKTRIFGELSAGDVLFPSTRACVSALAAKVPLAIASGALHHEIESILRAGDLLRHFPVIVAADDVDECKPSPVPYLTAAAKLGVDPARCVAVEDSAAGLAAARAAGMRTVAITTTSPKAALADADDVIDSLEELAGVLGTAPEKPSRV